VTLLRDVAESATVSIYPRARPKRLQNCAPAAVVPSLHHQPAKLKINSTVNEDDIIIIFQ